MTIDTDQIFKAINGLYGLPKGALTFVLCIAAGFAMKKSPWIPNNRIAFAVCVVGAIILPLMSDFKSSAIESVRVFIFTNLAIGFIVGAAATLFYRWVIKRLLEKFGLDDSNTSFIKAQKAVDSAAVETVHADAAKAKADPEFFKPGDPTVPPKD